MLKLRKFRENVQAKVSAEGILGIVVAIVAGLYAIAYVLPSGMSALGGANTTGWPTGTSDFITPIGIFVMIGILVIFARVAAKGK
jgi:hypothetical protein